MSYLRFESLEGFLEEALRRRIRGVVLRWTRETRPSFEGTRVTVGHVERWALVAYDRPTVLMLEQQGIPPEGLAQDLEGRGFTVRKVRDNIT